MSTVTSGLDPISQDWVQKFHFENKVDLSLQSTEKGESGKIEIDEIPTQMPSTNTKSGGDSYLQSILSSNNVATNNTSGTTTSTTTSTTASNITATCTNGPACVCYKCQRQRRRAGIAKVVGSPSGISSISTRTTSTDNTNNTSNTSNTSDGINNKSASFYSTTSTVKTTNTASSTASPTSTSPSPHSSVTNLHSISNPVSPSTPIPSPQQAPKRANTLRKTPTLRSYEMHMPKPTYSQDDSIYRVNDPRSSKDDEVANGIDEKGISNSEQYTKEGYKISWKEDETGDDILPSLVTFHTIFEEKGDDSPDGLSDLLEQRARQLRDQKLREQEKALFPNQHEIPELPPRLKECLTLSYRTGPKHNPLTLYHTMKMQTQKERLQAYGLAFKHCVHADSGLRNFVKKERGAPVRESSKLIQPVKKPTHVKRSLLHPLGARKNKLLGEHDMIWSASSDNLVPLQKRSIEISAPILISAAPIDVIAATQTLVPNAYLNNDPQNENNNSRPYEHIDIPSRPRATDAPNFKDTSSISSTESYNKNKRPNRLFSSLGRKTSVKSQHSIKETSIQSIDNHPEYERVLDELCRILPHINRQLLSPYVLEANGDYMAALQLCRAAVMSGKLS
ncbi:hypothetical protein K501DRAFT_247198 [Backusella circina FSU 941]|nr:hypothetical protein K501DRAFT_247198 [Backusella circina FSU 941]